MGNTYHRPKALMRNVEIKYLDKVNLKTRAWYESIDYVYVMYI